MGQHDIVVALAQRQLQLQAVFALTRRGDPTPSCRHALAHGHVAPLHTRRIDLPVIRRQHLLNPLPAPAYEAVLHQAPPPVGFHHLYGMRGEGPNAAFRASFAANTSYVDIRNR
jgi:hypothetical protein